MNDANDKVLAMIGDSIRSTIPSHMKTILCTRKYAEEMGLVIVERVKG